MGGSSEESKRGLVYLGEVGGKKNRTPKESESLRRYARKPGDNLAEKKTDHKELAEKKCARGKRIRFMQEKVTRAQKWDKEQRGVPSTRGAGRIGASEVGHFSVGRSSREMGLPAVLIRGCPVHL